ncbi:hypothetical protein P8452_59314 [Trifolium repens]|nr:hypothetical protein P8452_59314 [Trifolium repens]
MIILFSLFLFVATNLVAFLPCVKDEDCPPHLFCQPPDQIEGQKDLLGFGRNLPLKKRTYNNPSRAAGGGFS